MEVSRAKDKSSVCSACYYTLRGSFAGVKQDEVKVAIKKHPTVKTKFLVTIHSTLVELAPSS